MPRSMPWRLFFAAFLVCGSAFTRPDAAHSGGRAIPTGQIPGEMPAGAAPAALTPASCNGSLVVLTPGTEPFAFNSASTDQERGEFITALEDFHICSMGIKLEVAGFPQTLNAYIYAASNLTRGPLLASGSVSMSGAGPTMHFVPIDFTLKACQDYELIFVVPAFDNWERWDTHFTPIPFDVAGSVRVRYPSCGCSLTFAFPHIELVGAPGPTAHTSDFAGPNATSFANGINESRGIYVNMRETSRLSSFGFEADLVAGQVLTAAVYSATGTTRGSSTVATGTYVVPSSGMQWHDVPINALLVEGKHYDLAIQFGNVNAWYWWDENTFAEPFTRDVYDVLTAELSGTASNFALPHFRAKWDERAGGIAFDLAKPGDTALATNQANGAYGAYITALVKEPVYAVGWLADVPPGETITATLYDATGTTRGTLFASGTIVSGAGGMRWHDIPLSWELYPGNEYDINITFSNATAWRYWDDRTGLPYTSYGLIQVRNSELNADASNFALIQMRVHACNPTLTAAGDAPLRTPMFLAAPAPNPAGNATRVDFSLEESAPVSLRVYDVAGRLVSTALEGTRAKGWSSAEIDSQHLASGVYFLKLQSSTASVTRKFVVLH